MRNRELCFECKHSSGYTTDILQGCRAYPNGIDWQKDIIEHNEPFDDQEGDFVFEWACDDCFHSCRYHEDLPFGTCRAYPRGKFELKEFIGKGHTKILPNQVGDFIYTSFEK